MMIHACSLTIGLNSSFWRWPESRQHSCLATLLKATFVKRNPAQIPSCRARWLLHKPTATQAHNMLRETPATPSAGMTK